MTTLKTSTAYYLARGRSLEAIERWQDEWQAFTEAAWALTKELGAKSYYATNHDYRLRSFTFDKAPDPELFKKDRHGYWTPRGNTKAGRALRKRMESLPEVADVLPAMGLPSWGTVIFEGRWYTSSVELFGDEWLIGVPFGADPERPQPEPYDAERISLVRAAELIAGGGS